MHWPQLSQKHNEMPFSFSLFTETIHFRTCLSLKICDEYLFQDICIHMGCIKSDCRLFVRLVIVGIDLAYVELLERLFYGIYIQREYFTILLLLLLNFI